MVLPFSVVRVTKRPTVSMRVMVSGGLLMS